jgi:hypothetical protein
MDRRCLTLIALLAATTAWAAGQPAAQPAKPTPDVTGEWTGTWGPYQLEPMPEAKAKPPMKLDCTVVRKNNGWQATFEGECGRPYKYTITMDGRQAGDVVLFKGTTDLGEKDGGVYDWIGRATDKEFIGFYTSAKYTGVFRLTRKKAG